VSSGNRILRALVDRLATSHGLTQAKIASEVAVSPQFLSDVLNGRRQLTELLARRLGERFGVDYHVILEDNAGASFHGCLQVQSRMLLPILPHPVEGDPRLHPRWDGSLFEAPGLAMAHVKSFSGLYALRFGLDDMKGRLHRGDLVLVDQTPNASAEISVILIDGNRRGKCVLARRQGSRWIRLADGNSHTDARVVGHCVAVLWSALYRK
jgi:transcriptional regulator with XRE-family HTH domain